MTRRRKYVPSKYILIACFILVAGNVAIAVFQGEFSQRRIDLILSILGFFVFLMIVDFVEYLFKKD